MKKFNQDAEAIMSSLDEWKTKKKRSPVIAGILSALIPGAGKVYAKNQDTTPKLREGLNPLREDGQGLREEGRMQPVKAKSLNIIVLTFR